MVKKFIYGDCKLIVQPFFHLADHHAAGIMAAIPQGRNVYRDIFSNSTADFYHLIAYQAQSFLLLQMGKIFIVISKLRSKSGKQQKIKNNESITQAVVGSTNY